MRPSGLEAPNRLKLPSVGLMVPTSIPMVVVLPLPLGPRKPNTWPFSTPKEIRSTASTDFAARFP